VRTRQSRTDAPAGGDADARWSDDGPSIEAADLLIDADDVADAVRSELGGSAPVVVLKPSGATTLPDGESALTVTPGEVAGAVSKLMKG